MNDVMGHQFVLSGQVMNNMTAPRPAEIARLKTAAFLPSMMIETVCLRKVLFCGLLQINAEELTKNKHKVREIQTTVFMVSLEVFVVQSRSYHLCSKAVAAALVNDTYVRRWLEAGSSGFLFERTVAMGERRNSNWGVDSIRVAPTPDVLLGCTVQQSPLSTTRHTREWQTD